MGIVRTRRTGALDTRRARSHIFPSGLPCMLGPKSTTCGAPNLTLLLLKPFSPNRLSVAPVMFCRGAVHVAPRSVLVRKPSNGPCTHQLPQSGGGLDGWSFSSAYVP